MPDYIGNIPVPEVIPSGVFPLVPDFPHGRTHQPEVIVHQFGSANAKIEQRFLLGNGAKRFTVRKAFLRETDWIALRDFWESKAGPYGVFTYNAPNDDGNGTTLFICRFSNEPLSWEMLSDAVCTLGVTLIETPTTSPAYTLNQTVTRFPTSELAAALLSQVQELILLVKIRELSASVRDWAQPGVVPSGMPHRDAPACDPLQQLARRFEEWRNRHAPRSRLPVPLWAAAVELARQQGVYRTARTLRLDYASLKKKVQARPHTAAATAGTAPAAFVELLAPAGSLASDCLIELESARGGKMRIEMKMTAPEAASLLRAWREGEA